ncbi:AAA family ATPase [Thermorudis peleae]|uniref:AAA family ATPase n=1 Tax=Thermorudis peleae TaxID=1382356 RepID=UPI000690B050|nr:MoxR family ATPase [Thermorudis peleae]
MSSVDVQELATRISENVERVIVGKTREVRLVLVALLCRGHVLIEDVPGVGKTVLAKAIARSIGCSFKRIQFTPDLLPSDVTGVSVYNQQTGRFEYRPGPIIAQIVLADEINRATPKTQSALLEAMEENQVTVDGVTYALPVPFIVLATENPIEYEGTFPLPEAQLDRFLIRLSLGYPSHRGEVEILDRQHYQHPLEQLRQVVTVEELVAAQEAVRHVQVDDLLKEYIVSLVEATRQHDEVYLGAGPRGSLALYNAARAWAAMQGRDYVIPDDVKELAEPTLAHRIIVNPAARMRNVDSRSIVQDVLARVPVPGSQPVRAAQPASPWARLPFHS